MKLNTLCFLCCLIFSAASAQSVPPSQQVSHSPYDPRALFPAQPLIPEGTPYRESDGTPGPAYWQNRADYHIDASLDEVHQVIKGRVTITYTNHSPHALDYLWLQLDQNAYSPHSRGLDAGLFLDSNRIKTGHDFTGGYTIHSVKTSMPSAVLTSATATTPTAASASAAYFITDTRMQVRLSTPLKPGAAITIAIDYDYRMPRHFANADFNVNRTDILPTPGGDIYAVAQWYPRMCVLDDVEGWNVLPYLGNGEFYLEYGDFNVNLTLPSAYIVSASGELLNPEEVLTKTEQQRYAQAKNSESKVYIRSPKEVSDPASRPAKPTCTWKFRIHNARDFAWTASRSFVWEGIGINLPSGRKVLGQSLYPLESMLPGSWQRSSEYVKFTIEYFSKMWLEYPYPCAVNVASNLDGMEYPGIVFCSARDTGNAYFMVVNHELGHTWFPMVVGGNERKYAWMDEGFNTFIDHLACQKFNNGEFKGYSVLDPSIETYFADSLVPLMTRPDAIPGDQVFLIQYQKTAYLLGLLREHILGPDRFDYAFRHYIRTWAYKHPTPWDFFRSMNSAAGEDLTWFWKEAFIDSYQLDQAVKNVSTDANDPGAGAFIAIDNLGQAAMPLELEIVTAAGKTIRRELPVEIWEYTAHYLLKTGITEPIVKVVIDPDRVYPDVNRSNNTWTK